MGISRSLAVACLLGILVSCAGREATPPLRILLSADILSADPNQETEAVTDSVLLNSYEPLVALGAELEVRMVLAESYQNPTPERWRFQLRRGVRFHDGTPFTAQSVRDSVDAVRRSGQEASVWLAHVSEVAVVSPHVVEFVTREPRALLAHLPFLYITRPGPAGSLVGTGPYRIEEWERGRHIALSAFEGYWGDRPEFARARLEPEPDGARRVHRLREGSADLAYSIPHDIARTTQPGVRFVRRTGITVYYLGFNLRPRKDNPFTDLRVRRALHLALDREELVERVLGGAGAVATQPVAPMVFGYDPALQVPRRDVAEARALLAQAGHGSGLRSRLDFAHHRRPFAELIRARAKEAGFDLELSPMAASEVHDRAEQGRSDLFYVGWDCSTGEASEFFEFCLHSPGRGYGAANYGGYANPVIDDIAERNSAILDPRARQSLLQRAAAVAMADLPILPLYVEDDVYGVREGFTFVARADSAIRLLDVRRVPR